MLQTAHGDEDISDKEMQIIHREFLRERDAKLNHPDSHSRIQNIDDLMDVGFNITEYSPYQQLEIQSHRHQSDLEPVLKSTPRPIGGSPLNISNSIPNEENAYMYNSFTGIAGQVEPQKLTRVDSNDKPMGSDNSASTGNSTIFYPGEISSKNQGMSTSPQQHIKSKTVQTEKTRGTSVTQISQPKGSQNAHTNQQPQPSTINGGTKPALAFQPRNPGTGRPHVQCSACGSYDHFRKDCHQDNFCTRCRLKSHATQMCRAPVRNNICIYCGSTQHSLGNCTSQPNGNREEPRSVIGWKLGWLYTNDKYGRLPVVDSCE